LLANKIVQQLGYRCSEGIKDVSGDIDKTVLSDYLVCNILHKMVLNWYGVYINRTQGHMCVKTVYKDVHQ